MGRGKVVAERPNLPEPPKAYSPAVESRVGKINAARAAETGLNALAERGRIGDPGSASNAQILARAVTKAGFGENFVERFKKLARKNLIASETTRVGGDKRYVPDDADVTALAHEMARRKADNHPEPQMRSVLRDLADTGFNYQASGNLVKGIQKVEPEKVRKGLLGNQVVETPTQERERKKAAFIAQERRPARIAEEGVGDVAMRKNIAEMDKLEAEAERAIELGDIQLAEELKQKRMSLLTDFESRMAEEGIQSGDYSPAATERTATNKTGENAEERIRGAKGKRYSETRIDTADKGSENEGLKNIPGTIATEPSETSDRGFAVIASDPKLYNKYLERFSDADVKAIEKAWSKFEGVQRTDKDGNEIPGRDYSPIEQMRRGEILAKFAKTLGIEALGKHGEITARGMNRGVVRGPEEEAIANERSAGVRSSMQLIDNIISGKRSYSGLNKYETLRETGSDIRAIVDSLKNITGTKQQRARSESNTKKLVAKAINSAAAGNPYKLASLREQMAAIVDRGQLPEQQIASAVGSAPQVEAILGDVGTRIRGGASTIAMRPFKDVTTGELRKGIGPAKIPLGTEPVRTGGVEGNAMRESALSGYVFGEPASRGRRAPTGTPARARGVSLRAEAERIRAANQPKEPEAPAPKQKQFKDLPKDSELHRAVLEWKRSLDNADVNYGEGGTKSNLQMTRIDRLTRDYIKETRKIKPNRVPRQISNVRELSRAQAELDKLKAEVALNNNKLDEIRRYIAPKQTKDMLEETRRRVPVDQGDDFRPHSTKRRFMPQTQDSETFRDYQSALEGRIKVLQGSVTEYEKVLEKAYSTGKLKPRVTGAALREGERGEMSPRMMDIDRLKRRLDDRNLAPKERARIEKILSRIRVEEGGFQNPPEKKTGPIKPGAAPMSTAYVPRRFDPITDEREIVPGQKPVGNVIPPKGRRKSETRKRAARNRKFPEKQYGTRSSDIATLRGAPDAVQRLLEGLPR